MAAVVAAGRGGEIGRLGLAGDIGPAVGVDVDVPAGVLTAAAQEGAVDRIAAAGVEFPHKDVFAAANGRAISPIGGGKVARPGLAGDIGAAIVLNDIACQIDRYTTQQGAVGQRSTAGGQLGHKGVAHPAVEGKVPATRRGGKVGRSRFPRYIGIAVRIDIDIPSPVIVDPAEVGAVNQGAAPATQADHKGVQLAAIDPLIGPRRGGKVRRTGVAGHVGAALAIYGQALAKVVPAAAQEGAILQAAAVGAQLEDKGVGVPAVGRVGGPGCGG